MEDPSPNLDWPNLDHFSMVISFWAHVLWFRPQVHHHWMNILPMKAFIDSRSFWFPMYLLIHLKDTKIVGFCLFHCRTTKFTRLKIEKITNRCGHFWRTYHLLPTIFHVRAEEHLTLMFNQPSVNSSPLWLPSCKYFRHVLTTILKSEHIFFSWYSTFSNKKNPSNVQWLLVSFDLRPFLIYWAVTVNMSFPWIHLRFCFLKKIKIQNSEMEMSRTRWFFSVFDFIIARKIKLLHIVTLERTMTVCFLQLSSH